MKQLLPQFNQWLILKSSLLTLLIKVFRIIIVSQRSHLLIPHFLDPMIRFKGATKFCFVHYSRVVMIFFSAVLYKPKFCTYYFISLDFCFSLLFFLWLFFFRVFGPLVFRFFGLWFEFNSILKDLKTFINSASIINIVLFDFVLLVLTLYKRSTQGIYTRDLEGGRMKIGASSSAVT